MHIEELNRINDDYQHIYLSPHLDDAVLSCGGAIASHRAGGERVLVIAVCTAAPSPDGPFNNIAQELHRSWGLQPAEVVTARLREDARAMELVGADSFHAGMLDAIYRYPEAYHDRATLFGVPAPDDPLLQQLRTFINHLRTRAPRAKLYAPLAIGDHVDHQITYQAAADGNGEVLFYEDFPYAAAAGAAEARLKALGRSFAPRVVDIESTLTKKISGIAAYSSQLDELFGGVDGMEQAVARYARGLVSDECVERLWLPV